MKNPVTPKPNFAEAQRLILDCIRKAPPVHFIDVSDETCIGPVLVAVSTLAKDTQ